MSQCDVCYKTFQSACNLVTHYRMHTDERPFTCNICQKGFRQRGHLTDHIKLHGDEKSYKCEICGRAFKQSSGLRNHRSRFHRTYVPKKTKSRSRTPKPDTIRSAGVKAVRASRERTVDVDVENLHRCDICDETFLTGAKLDNHIAWHARRKRYKCMVCRRIFKHLSIFKKHQKLHERNQKKSSNNRTQHTNMSDVQIQDPGRIKATRDKIGGPFCETCQKSFSCRFSFNRHIKEYHEGLKRARTLTRYDVKNKKFRCSICQKMFSTIYSLRVHRERIHPSKTHRCHICSKTYGLINDLKNHYKQHNNLHLPYKCDICGMPFQYQSQLKEHYMVHARQKQEHLQLNEQPLSSGSSEGPHECDVCGKHFRYPSRLREHLIVHQNEPSMPNSDWPYQCTVCQKVFRYPSRLQGHYKTHANEKQEDSESQQARHLCTICGKAFQFASHLRRHQTTHYKQQEEPASNKTLTKYPHECDACGRLFQYPSQLREHSVVHSEQGETSNSRQSKRPYRKNQNQAAYHQPKQNTAAITPQSECYECDVCGNTFQHRAFLARHYVVHERDSGKKPYSCAYCERSFWQTNHLKRHCQGQHNTDNIFKCEVCSVAFKKKVELRDHVLTCHGGTQAKQDSSQNEIPAKRGLQRVKRHVGRPPKKRKKRFGTNTHVTQTVNTGGLKYTENSADNSGKKQYTLTTKKRVPTCNICGAKFSTASGLRMHLDIHFDRRPYSCRFCEMKFRQLGHLSSHCKTIHHEEFPYQCELCDMPFKGTVAFKTHQQIAHGLTENPNELDGFEKSAQPRYSNIDFEPKKYTRIVHSGQTQYACGFCDVSARTFKSLSGLRRHITIVHTSNVNQPISDENANYPQGMVTMQREMVTMPREESPVTLNPAEEIYKCNVCSVIVHGWEALEAHEKAHSRRSVNSPSSTAPVFVAFTPPTPSIEQTFECTFCGAEFDAMSREAFDEHQLQHELVAEKPMGIGYICGECDQEFAMLADLVNHHEQAH